MILETDENKFIIAPCGDLFLCVFTTADAHLGLIRVVLKISSQRFPVINGLSNIEDDIFIKNRPECSLSQ